MNNIIKFGLTADGLERTINIDFTALTEMQTKILFKYESVENIDITQGQTIQGLVNRLDHYILHAVEEVVEARQENQELMLSGLVNRTIPDYPLKEELIDIILYLGTIRAILEHNSYKLEEFKLDSAPSVISASSTEVRKSLNNEESYDHNKFDTMFSEVVSGLIGLRMQFPERKWHKPYKEVTDLQMHERLIFGIQHIDYCITTVVSVLFELTDDEEINEIINTKHNFVMELKKVTGGKVE
jgi:hypothetical protein